MIFDLTDLQTGQNSRYRPRKRSECQGYLECRGERVGGLSTLTMLSTPGLVGGRFGLRWHRQEAPFLVNTLSITVEYKEQGRDPLLWVIPDIQILKEGVVLVIASLEELFGEETPFFARAMQGPHAT